MSLTSVGACDTQSAADVMTREVRYFPEQPEVGEVMKTLFTCTHNGFPVVDAGPSGSGRTLKGLILRKQLYVLIKTRAWENNRVSGVVVVVVVQPVCVLCSDP